MEPFLDREDLGKDARLASLGGFDVLRIIGGDDFLTSLGMIHDRVLVRGEAVEKPVEDTSRHEGIDIANRETLENKHVSNRIQANKQRRED